MKKEIWSDAVAGLANVMSQAIEANGLIFVSGQIHVNNEWELIGDNVSSKLQFIMDNIERILDAAGLGLNDIVKVTIYVTDMEQMTELNKYYPTYFSKPLPAREAVCVKELPLGATIEISVVATR